MWNRVSWHFSSRKWPQVSSIDSVQQKLVFNISRHVSFYIKPLATKLLVRKVFLPFWCSPFKSPITALDPSSSRKISPLNVLSWLRDISNALLHVEKLNLPLRALSCKHILLNSAHCAKLAIYSTTRLLNDMVSDRFYVLHVHFLHSAVGIRIVIGLHGVRRYISAMAAFNIPFMALTGTWEHHFWGKSWNIELEQIFI